MELLMKNIHMCRQAKQAGTQITLDEDFNVPDVRPDVQMIIQSREQVTLEHTRAESGKLFVDGFMEVGILYLDDTKERQIHRLDTKLSFDETIAMEGLEPGDNVRIRYETEDLNVTLINSRKLAIRGLLSFSASVDEIYDMSAAVETQSKILLCERKKKLELMQLEVQKKDILRLKEEVQIPANKPNIQEILWDSVQLRGCQVQLRDGHFLAKGNVFLFVLYRTEDESQTVQWQEQLVPFEGKIECSGCKEDLVPDMEISLVQPELTVKEDTDGEMRLFHLEGIVEFEIRLYGTEEAEILEDVYSPEKDLGLLTSQETYESLVMKNESKCKASGRIRIQGAKPRILQICHSNGSIKIDKTQVVPEGIRIEGAVVVSIMYISSDDTMPFAVLDGTIPFTHLAEVPQIDNRCRYSLTADMEQLLATMADSEEIEVKVTIGLHLFVARTHKQQCIHEISEKEYEPERLEAIPGITAYIVQGQESLWDIAKQYYMTPQQIAEMNGLESEEIKKGDCLILMKTMVRQIS
ncbi:MAG: DUF3794 domain-containing protein [Lachnospiraceae bacterium]|nr:DUF3794 domain-containing protein [Lachnospiraceae bacterium]MDD7077103.1 DUF3794 domain-containing protein [Lachnospiraceae bacterium]MDY3729983.1 DUF3794 domain-containing protein [Candidatus Choladocola sp.]